MISFPFSYLRKAFILVFKENSRNFRITQQIAFVCIVSPNPPLVSCSSRQDWRFSISEHLIYHLWRNKPCRFLLLLWVSNFIALVSTHPTNYTVLPYSIYPVKYAVLSLPWLAHVSCFFFFSSSSWHPSLPHSPESSYVDVFLCGLMLGVGHVDIPDPVFA